MPFEELLGEIVAVLVVAVETVAATVIAVGAAVAAVRCVRAVIRGEGAPGFVRIRLDLGRSLVLGLEFQLASDVLRTAVAPSFEELGTLAAVAAIRTALNYFVAKEIDREREELAGNGSGSDQTGRDKTGGDPTGGASGRRASPA
jgi:uncharacterized membrane protein